MRYVAFFRGINVGGKSIVKMQALKGLFEALGYQGVRTYIQSGNVVFDAAEAADQIKEKVSGAFCASFGFDSAVLLRSQDEMDAMLAALPFSPQEMSEAALANPEVEHLYVYMLDRAPSSDAIARLEREHGGPDRLRAGRHEVYLLCHDSIRTSKLAAALVKLHPAMTARNWKTISKLAMWLNE